MIDVLFQTLPFFALIGLGYGAGRTGFFSEEATAYLTKFVFYFALSAMLFRFSATLPIESIFDRDFMLAYFLATPRRLPLPDTVCRVPLLVRAFVLVRCPRAGRRRRCRRPR